MNKNIENLVRTELQNHINKDSSFAETMVLSEYNQANVSFPCVVLNEMDNRSNARTMTTDGEQHAILMYQVDWYADTKEELKELAALSCAYFESRRFTRLSMGMVDNLLDKNIKRMVARFTVLHGKNNYLYQV